MKYDYVKLLLMKKVQLRVLLMNHTNLKVINGP